jgi:hypothetical protein
VPSSRGEPITRKWLKKGALESKVPTAWAHSGVRAMVIAPCFLRRYPDFSAQDAPHSLGWTAGHLVEP